MKINPGPDSQKKSNDLLQTDKIVNNRSLKSDEITQSKKITPIVNKSTVNGYETIKNILKLTKIPQQGEIIYRLLHLPLIERADALVLQLILSRRGIDLSRTEWEELWGMVNGGAEKIPTNKEEIKELFIRNENNPYAAVSGEKDSQYYRIFRDEQGRGSVMIQLEKDKLVNLFLRMETKRRKWEFHLSQQGQKRGSALLTVFTDDPVLVNSPPREWNSFRKSLKKFQIRTERAIKRLRNDYKETDNRNREMDHLVDIIL